MAKPPPSPIGEIKPWGARNEGWGDRDRNGPDTPMRALMEAAPGCEPQLSQLERMERRDTILDVLDILDTRERFVIEALVFERVSQQNLARRMGLARRTLRDIANKALAKLREALDADV